MCTIPRRPDLNHTPQLNQTIADARPIINQTTKVMDNDGHLQLREAAAVYSVKRHFLSVGLEIIPGNEYIYVFNKVMKYSTCHVDQN